LDAAYGPGNVLFIEIESENITEVFTGFGQKGLPAEKVAEKTARSALQYLENGAPVGEHLADQLLIPMAIAGGGLFRTGPLTLHTKTNIEVIGKFLDIKIKTREISDKQIEVEIE
jgi:RNA 3'-terminal phosphate cyclase (ATP)